MMLHNSKYLSVMMGFKYR